MSNKRVDDGLDLRVLRRIQGVLAIGLVFLLLTGCSPSPSPATTAATPAPASTIAPAPASTSAPAPASVSTTEPTAASVATTVPKRTVLKIAFSPELTTLDPHKILIGAEASIARLVTEGLTRIDTAGKLHPWLATGWTTSSDGLTWTFKLRPNVKFHDGTPFNAQAVKINIERTRDPKIGGKASFYAPIKNVRVIDDLTVAFEFDKPLGTLPQVLAHWSAEMVSPASIANDTAAHSPAGTGPYKVQSWDAGKVTLVKNADYWQEGIPVTDEIQLQAVVDGATRTNMLKSGEVDLISPTPPTSIQDLETVSGVKVDRYSGNRVMWATFNFLDPKFQDLRVRQAINYAIDRDAIIKTVLQNTAHPEYSIIAKGTFGYKDPGSYAYDLSKAKQLLKDAGWTPGSDGILQKDGQRFAFKYAATRGRYPADAQIAEVIQAQLKVLGMDVTVEADEYATWIAKVKVAPDKQQFGMVQKAIAAALFDADTPFRLSVLKESLAPANWNFGYYTNDNIEKWAAAEYSSSDPAEREQLMGQIQQQVYDDTAGLFLWTFDGIVSRRDYVKDVELFGGDQLVLEKAYALQQ